MKERIDIVRSFELNENQSDEFWANVFPTGEFYHWWYGKITVDEDLLKEIKRNFDLGFPHYGVPVNVHHEPELGLYGQIIDLQVKESGLWALIKLNEKGKQKVYEEGYKYYSVEIDYEYMDPETGDNVGAVLVGLALTYLPAHPLVAAETKSGFVQMFGDFTEKLFGWLKGLRSFMIPRVINTPSSDNEEWNWDWSRDADTIINNLGWSGLAKACAYVDMENYDKDSSDGLPHNKAAYKLPHHKYINGRLTLVWGGVRAAMQRLKSADIPENDRKKVYNHLAAHYRHFEKKPPEFNEIGREVDEMGDKEMQGKLQEYETKIASYEEKVKEYETRIKEYEAKINELNSALKQFEEVAKKEQEEKLNLWLETWRQKGIAPVLLEKIFAKVKEGKITVEEAEEIFENAPSYTEQKFSEDALDALSARAKEIAEEINKKRAGSK